jgi:probable rRNA maturation factor
MATTRRARVAQRNRRPRRAKSDAGARSLSVTVTSPDGPLSAGRGLASWLARTAPAGVRGDVTVALVSDARMRTLNRTFRGADHATDVLSFQLSDDRYLGDVVIATGVAARQASAVGHSLSVELKVLALHGLLHLLGYDHERDRGEMERIEAKLRQKGGLRGGLIGRDAR